MLSHASGENILVELEIDGEKAGLALVQEVQHAPVGGEFCMSIFTPSRWTK